MGQNFESDIHIDLQEQRQAVERCETPFPDTGTQFLRRLLENGFQLSCTNYLRFQAFNLQINAILERMSTYCFSELGATNDSD